MISKLKKIDFIVIRLDIDIFFLRDVDTEKVFVSKKISFGYYIGYLYHDNKVKPLHIRLPKTTVYVKSYEGKTKWMYF